jgi:hypothetical protein
MSMHGASDGTVDIGRMIAKGLFASAVETLLICAIAATAQTKVSGRDKCPLHHDGGTKERVSDLSAMAQATKADLSAEAQSAKAHADQF